MQKVLYYIHDSMCSWCYAFKPTFEEIKKELGDDFKIVYINGGLARDSEEAMPMDMREKIESIWYDITKQVGTEFNHDFWKNNTPRRSTYLACRATIVAREVDKEEEMIKAIQKAYYLDAQNPSDLEVLAKVAKSIGIDEEYFKVEVTSDRIEDLLQDDLNLRRSLKVRVFPTLLLKYKKEIYPINIKYNEPKEMLAQIKNLTENIYF